jgi:aspartyl-tRNA(Asn)/glutamyl-tRNA(Gln) amidotransferase subunit C
LRLSREDVDHIALLARLGLSEDERERVREQLSVIIENFEVLQGVDTEGVEPTAQSVVLENVMRSDSPVDSFTTEDILSNAPEEEEGSFKVQAVFEDMD